MKRARRVMAAILAVASVVFLAGIAFAAPYPEKSVLAIVPFSPGGGNDIVMRLIGNHISGPLGTSLVIENRPGAGGQVGWTALAKASPDGYTIGASSQPSMVLVKTLRDNVPFDLNDFTYICNFQVDPLVWIVNSDSDLKTAKDVVELAKKQPGVLNIAGDGPQSNVQLQHLVYSKELGIDCNFVSYSGSGPAVTALLGKQVDVALTTLSSATSQLESGRVRALVMFYDEKIDGVDIMSSKEAFGASIPSAGTALRGVLAPKGLPQEVTDTLEKAFKAVTEDPAFLEQAKSLGLIIKFIGSKDSQAMVEDSTKLVEEFKTLF